MQTRRSRRKRSQEISSASSSNLGKAPRRKKSALRVMLPEDFWRENDRLIFEAAKDPIIREKAETSQTRCYVAMVDYFEKHGVNVNVKQIRSRMDKYRNHLKNYRTRNKWRNTAVRQYVHDNLDFLASLFDSDKRSRSKSSKDIAQTMSAELPSVQNGNGQTAVLSLEKALICIHNHIPESNLLFYKYTFPIYQQPLEEESDYNCKKRI